MALKAGQKKLDKNNNNRIDAQDFKILKAEKAKGRGMGLQDEKVKPGKVMKASVGGESRDDKLRKAFPRKSPESRAKIETMLGSKNTPMKKERLFEGDKARRREGLKKIIQNVRKVIPSGRLSREDIKKATDVLKNKKPKSGSSVKDIFKSYGKYDGKPIELSKGGGADMGTKMSDKRKRRFKEILERLKSPTTINIKSEYKPGTRSPMQRDRKREGYRAKVESKGGKVLFMDEMKKGGSVMARGCKLGRKKATKLY